MQWVLCKVLPKCSSLCGVVPRQLHDTPHDGGGYEAVVESGDRQHGRDMCHASSLCADLIKERRGWGERLEEREGSEGEDREEKVGEGRRGRGEKGREGGRDRIGRGRDGEGRESGREGEGRDKE